MAAHAIRQRLEPSGLLLQATAKFREQLRKQQARIAQLMDLLPPAEPSCTVTLQPVGQQKLDMAAALPALIHAEAS